MRLLPLALPLGVAPLLVATLGASAACGSGSSAPAPSPVTVHVVYPAGEPAVDIAVIVDGVMSLTDDNGDIKRPSVSASYDIVLGERGLPLVAYEGVTERTVTVVVGDATYERAAASVSIDEYDSDMTIVLIPRVPDGTGVRLSGPWATIAWAGNAPLTVKLDALKYANGTTPVQYLATATTSVTFTPGSASTSVSWKPDWQPVTAAPASVSAQIQGFGIQSASVSLKFHGLDTQLPSVPWNASGPTAIRLPPLDGPFDLGVIAGSANGGTLWDTSPSIDVASTPTIMLPEPLDALAPADGATGVSRSTAFRTSAPAAVEYRFTPVDDGTAPSTLPRFTVVAAGDAHIPDFSSFGIRSFAGATYRWTARSSPQRVFPLDWAKEPGPSVRMQYAATPERGVVFAN